METVLFVCVHNSGRSQMAEALFNRLAQGRARATSAGTAPSANVDPQVVQAMTELGIDISTRKPKLLTQDMLAAASRVITMGCEVEEVCPATLVPSQDWGLEDPKGKPIETVRRVRDEIARRVQGLLGEVLDTPAVRPSGVKHRS